MSGYDLEAGLSEGWANLFSGLARNDPLFVNSIIDTPNWIEWEFEQPIPDPPYYNSQSEYDPILLPPRSVPQYEGAHIVGAVTVALWDLYDAVDDDDYYVASTLWGHNNDHNGSESWNGIDAIWDVLTNFDPQPANPDHNYCWNIYEFIHGWRQLGYPIDSTFINIFEAHNVPVFLPGDFDDNGSTNVGDLTRLVAHLFNGGSGPNHLSAADLDASCDVDVADVTYIVAYLFGGGPSPLVGCVNNPNQWVSLINQTESRVE